MSSDSDTKLEESLLEQYRVIRSRKTKKQKELKYNNGVLQSKINDLTSDIAKLKSDKECDRSEIEQLKTKLEKQEWQASKSIGDLKTQCKDRLKAKDDVIADLRIRNERLEAEWRAAITVGPVRERSSHLAASKNGSALQRRVKFEAGSSHLVSHEKQVRRAGVLVMVSDSDESETDDQLMHVPETVMIEMELPMPSLQSTLHPEPQLSESPSPVPKKRKCSPLWDRVMASDSESDSDLVVDAAKHAVVTVVAKAVPASTVKRSLSRRRRVQAVSGASDNTRDSFLNTDRSSSMGRGNPKAPNDCLPLRESSTSDCKVLLETGAGNSAEGRLTSASQTRNASKSNDVGKSDSRNTPRTVDNSFDDFQTSDSERVNRVRQLADGSGRWINASAVGGATKMAERSSIYSAMTFEPLVRGVRQVRYKQMTLTQALGGERETTAVGQSRGNSFNNDDDLSRAVQNSLEENYPKTLTSSECGGGENNIDDNVDNLTDGTAETPPSSANNFLDETYVSSSILARHRASRLCSSGTVIRPITLDVADRVSEVVQDEDGVAVTPANVPTTSGVSKRVTGKPLEPVPSSTLNVTANKDKLEAHLLRKETQYDDFDLVPPKHQSPNYKYKEDPIRKRADRRRLEGHECRECLEYFADLPEEERKKRLNACSRHRTKYVAPSTPPHFWSVDFPTTQECKDRGYLDSTQHDKPLVSRRRRQL